MKRLRKLRFRASDDEAADLQWAAERCGLTIAEVARLGVAAYVAAVRQAVNGRPIQGQQADRVRRLVALRLNGQGADVAERGIDAKAD